jgi:hypothetical protein
MRLQKCEWPNDIARMARSVRAPKHAFSESVAEITYNPDAAILAGFTWQRALERFDFSDEWNNLGFGAVRVDGSKWSLAMPVQSQHSCSIAEVCVNTSPMLAYSALEDREGSSVLWYNRQVGPIDSFEWRLVEMFISSWRYDELPCRPVIQEIPWAYDAAVTMRLDCDEDIASAMPLKYAYDTMGIPLSLAINTNNLDGYNHNALLMELVAQGGSILSHSATHAPNWGGNYEAALYEAQESACQLQGVTGTKVRYAVSPFHQTPKFALQEVRH